MPIKIKFKLIEILSRRPKEFFRKNKKRKPETEWNLALPAFS